MRILFVHSHLFVRAGDAVLSDKLPYESWGRYLQYFDELTVLARVTEATTQSEKFPISSGEGVTFAFDEYPTTIGDNTKLRKLIERHEAVVVRLPSLAGPRVIRLARSLNKMIAIEVVGCAWDACWNYGSVRAKLMAPLLTLQTKHAIRTAKFVSYVSQEFLQSRYPPAPGAVTLAASNVSLSLTDPSVLGARLERIRSPGNSPVLGIVGALKTRYKGVHVAIRAMKQITRSAPDVVLRVLGGGDTTPYLRLAIRLGVERNVQFDGVLPSGGAVLNWLDGIDVYLQPSFTEGVPRALIEAMSRGCPAIASSVGGIPELLDDDCLVAPGAVRALADKISLRLTDIGWLERQAVRNFEASLEFDKVRLDDERKRFWGAFAKVCGRRAEFGDGSHDC